MYAWFIRTGFEKLEIAHRARCTHLQTQPGRIQPIDSSHLAVANAVGRLTAPRSALEELL
ncbi:hypothetical protein [Bordetella pertussis]|uniref:hypothetical protein n=1 Tax=Bordetella pertussis TaxID=520 RepID=UPI0003D3D7A5|nr:hypothetical protein [Bordetella pertussis]ETI06719.1 hypothetical protein L557_1936 [Bordetella pertussis STO1-CNMC-0004]